MNTKRKKYLAILLIICTVCIGAVFTTDASPKIRSKSITLNVEQATIGIGDIITLDGVMKPVNSTDSIKWSSSNKKVATVNKYGVVTAVGEGKATITAKTSSKKKAACKVTVKQQLSLEEVSALISKECLSEETVKKLIKENTLSEADVKKIVSENSGGNSGGNTGITDWADGTELKLYSNKDFPISQDGITVQKITVRKYHYNGELAGKLQKYKYIMEIEGTLADNIDLSKYWVFISFRFMNHYSSVSDSYLLGNDSDAVVNTSFQENGGKFTFTAEQYGIYADFDEYMIVDMSVEERYEN